MLTAASEKFPTVASNVHSVAKTTPNPVYTAVKRPLHLAGFDRAVASKPLQTRCTLCNH